MLMHNTHTHNTHTRARAQVLGILGSLSDARAVENELVMALGFEKFDLSKELLRNRSKIVWCTRLSRAQVGAVCLYV